MCHVKCARQRKQEQLGQGEEVYIGVKKCTLRVILSVF